MTPQAMNRRRFLHLTGGTAAGAAMIAAGVGLTATSPGAWALALSRLDAHQGKTLLKVARHVFPHDTLDDVYYAGVVQSLDGKAAANADVAAALADGVNALDSATAVPWIDLSDGYQIEILEGPGQALLHAPSAQHGGYIHRGFDDLNWLPDPDGQASPPPA